MLRQRGAGARSLIFRLGGCDEAKAIINLTYCGTLTHFAPLNVLVLLPTGVLSKDGQNPAPISPARSLH